MELLPIPLAMHELVADDVRLEDSRVPEQGYVPRQDVANAHGEGEEQLREREIPYLRARVDPLAGHAGDVLGQVAVDLNGQFIARNPLCREALVETSSKTLNLVPAGGLRHFAQRLHVTPELFLEIDPAHVASADPVLDCAPGIHAKRRGADHAAGEGRSEKKA